MGFVFTAEFLRFRPTLRYAGTARTAHTALRPFILNTPTSMTTNTTPDSAAASTLLSSYEDTIVTILGFPQRTEQRQIFSSLVELEGQL